MKNRNICEISRESPHFDARVAKKMELAAEMPPLSKRVRSLKWLRDQMPFQEIPSAVLIREDRDARD